MTEISAKQSSYVSSRDEMIEIDLKSVLNLIKQSYKLIAIITTVFLIFGIYYAETRPAVYRSTAMIEVSSNTPAALGAGGGAGGVNAALSGLGSMQASSSDVETVLLQSPYVLGGVAQMLNLDVSVSPKYAGFFARKWAEFRHIDYGSASVSFLTVPNNLLAKKLMLVAENNNQYTLFAPDGRKILNGVVGQLELANYFGETLQINISALNAKPGEKFNVVKLPTPDVANSIAGNLEIKEAASGTGILELNYSSHNREQAQKLLNAILVAAIQKNMKEKSQEIAKTLEFIAHQLPISENNLEDTEAKMNDYTIKSGIYNPEGEVALLERNLNTLQTTLDQLRFEKMMLLQKFTPLHPLVIAQIQKENEIKMQMDKIKSQMKKLPVSGEKEINMKRDAKIQDGIYTALFESSLNMEMMKASMVSSVRVLSAASYPISRIPVKKRMIIFASIVFGLMTSLAIIFIRHVLSPRIEDPDVVERALGISVSAIIPCSTKQLTYNKQVKRDKLYANTKPFLLARENPHDLSIEGIRSLRTTIQMYLLEAKNNVIAITGCSPSIGKSFISSNLAVLLSDLGKRILIIDADIRLGKLSQCFGKFKTPGLSTYLQHEETIDNIIQNVIPEKLDFIATGLYPENPSELLSHQALNNLIQTMKDRYDLVIIDTPPILAVTDPALILRYAAINLLVLGVGKDGLKATLHAKHTLEKAGVTLTGLVFNHVSQQKAGFGQNYGYGQYHYHYGQKK